jgi:hypothetical protein
MADSSQTMLARADFKAAVLKWRAHVRECSECARARHHHRSGKYPPCPRGGRMLADVTATAEQLAEELRRDAEPDPRQPTLF